MDKKLISSLREGMVERGADDFTDDDAREVLERIGALIHEVVQKRERDAETAQQRRELWLSLG